MADPTDPRLALLVFTEDELIADATDDAQQHRLGR